MDLNRKNVRALLGLITFATVLFVALWHYEATFQALGVLLGMLSFVFIGLALAFILNVPMRLIETGLFAPLNRRCKRLWPRVRRPLALVLTLVLLLGLIALVVFLVIPEMGRTIMVLTAQIPGFLSNASDWLTQYAPDIAAYAEQANLDAIDWQALGSSALSLLKNGATSLLTSTFSAATSVVSGVAGTVIGLILAVYVLLDKERLGSQVRRVLYACIPEARADGLLGLARRAERIFSAFIGGQCLESIILGCLFFLGMTILRFPFALMVSLLVGVTAFIPIFGAFIGGFVGTFMILVNQGFMPAVWFLLFFIILQQIEGNLIYPHVVGKSVMLPGIWVLIAVTLGGNLAGIGGMLLAVPTAALLYTLLRDAVNRRNAARGIPPEKL